MTNPSFHRHSLPCGRLPLALFLLLLLTWLLPSATGQSMEVRKTMKEELLPGYVVSNLAKEPEFLDLLKDAKPPVTDTNSLYFSILTTGNPNSKYFHVNKDTGEVVIENIIDREKVCSFKSTCELNFEVAARSVYGVFFKMIRYVVTITDINDNPPEFTQSQFELYVPEDSKSGESFQLPTAFDRDTGPGNGVSEYKILEGPEQFALEMKDSGFNTSDVFITLQNMVNREIAPSYKMLVGAIDGGLPSLTGTLTVQILVSDINDNIPVFEQSTYKTSISDETKTRHSILQVHATDADTGPNGELVYSFSARQPVDDLVFFRIEPTTGEIFLTSSIESRAGETIELVVEASDKGHPPKVSQCKVQIQVNDTKNSMAVIMVDMLGGKGMAEVSEYSELGKVVAHVSVRDPDLNEMGENDCTLDSAEFELVKMNGQSSQRNTAKFTVVLRTKLDRELVDMYNLTIACTDRSFPRLRAEEKFTVKVMDENDQTPRFSQRNYRASVEENKPPGQLIQKLEVTDNDIGINAEIDFEVLGINQQYFEVNNNSELISRKELDRESAGKMVVRVIARDRGDPPLQATATVLVTLMDVNDITPHFEDNVYSFEVEEGSQVGRFVGIVAASDEDLGVNQEIFFHLPLLYKQTENNFVISMEGGVIKTNKPLDREEQSMHSFVVLATDKGSPPLTGTASVVVQIKDVNDNDPYFIYPTPDSDSLSIPHTVEPKSTIVTIVAADADFGQNAAIIYSVSSINETSPFVIHPTTGVLHVVKELSPDDVGEYTLTLMANDQGELQQRATQAPLFIDVYFDNSTLLATVDSAGPSTIVLIVIIVCSVILVVLLLVLVSCICYKRCESRKKPAGVPNSASSSSTAKLQAGYYIAPGVRGSSSSFIGKVDEGGTTNNGHTSSDPNSNNWGMKTTNSYVFMMPPTPERGTESETIEIQRNGSALQHGLADNSGIDLDATDDGQFSTFKSQDDLLSPGLVNSLQRRRHDTSDVKPPLSDTCDDDMSCDSTSDSGRGGSDVDNGAAAAKEKARAQAATPISVKSGISNRLSPLPRDHERTFVTFRGDSPSSFRFDSDSDTLTRPQRSRVSPMPMMSSPTRRDAPRFEPGNSSFSARLSESDTDNDVTPRNLSFRQPSNIAGIHVPNSSMSGLNGERQPIRVPPLNMFRPPSLSQRTDSEAEQSDGGGSNTSSSLSRRNHVPRLPYYPNIEFSHHAYGARNSIGAYSNHSAASNSEGYYPDSDHGYNQGQNYNGYSSETSGPPYSLDNRMSANYGNVVSEFQESRPVSMEGDFLLPPYPEVAEDDVDDLAMHSGYTGFSPERDAERAALFNRSRFESSA